MVKFVFNSEKITERDEEGKTISQWTEFYLAGKKNQKWMLLDVLSGVRAIAGSYKEGVYVSDDYKFYVDIFSEATEVAEKPRTKAIIIEDYSGNSSKLIVFFPYQSISDQQMIEAIDASVSMQSFVERRRMKTRRQLAHKKRLPIPQSIQKKVLLRSKGKCEKCGENFESIIPNIHHKDGNARNNELTNLILLCPNCHSKTATYKKPKSSRN